MSGNHLPRTLILLLCGLGMACCPGLATAQEYAAQAIRWRTDYNQARQEAAERKLPILIDFYKDVCPFCVKLDNNFFAEPKVAKLINQYFIPLKVNGELAPHNVLASALNVDAFPTLVLAAHDGKILPPAIIGYQEPALLYDMLLRVLANTTEPKWMLDSLASAEKLMEDRDYPRAIATLAKIVEDRKTRPVQLKAFNLFKKMEEIGQERLALARELLERGKSAEALDSANEIMRNFPGLQAARDGTSMVALIMQSDEFRNQQRNRRAQELLVQAQQFYNQKDYVVCVERCSTLIKNFGDLPEGKAAYEMSATIKSDPAWQASAGEALADFLADIWITQADNCLRIGQTEQARQFYDRVLRAFPGTRQAQLAQMRLGQLVSLPTRGMPTMSPFGPPPR